ncbi:porin family protein [Echinicola soli]|uniref:Porin family protein n=1 Tax=Echinicola soli TaxID=2591634 RepID=A0A514CJK3_9BACT|nr:outer membrane beta-barrel protein [Echinicola soli]QDH80003.1 porin family protein [Echinicola soli]
MKSNLYLATLIVVLLACFLPTVSKAQFNEDGLVIRSGINFQYSKQGSPFSGLPENMSDDLETLNYYFTPGIGKFFGDGFYVGIEGRIGATSKKFTSMTDDKITYQSSVKNTIYGGGILLRKYFKVSEKFNPFVGLSNTFYKEKGDAVYPNQLYSYNQNNFTADIQLGAQYRISPRFGIEAYFTPGGLLVSKDMNSNQKADISPNFGGNGQSFSIGINYFLNGK